MHIDEIGSYGLNLIRSKARKLVGNYGFTWADFDDIQQEMLLELVQRLPNFDSSRSPLTAFITRVVKNKRADIIARRLSPSKEHFREEVSLNKPLHQEGRAVELCDTLVEATGPDKSLGIDFERALAGLPADQRRLWGLRVQGLTLTEIATQSGIARATLYGRWAKLCEHLKQAGLGVYFGNE